MAVTATVPAAIDAFLKCRTPDDWLDAAADREPDLLRDHANCELKAASTALGMIYRYPERGALCHRMSRLAREELRHFEQVRTVLEQRGVPFTRLSASRYAGTLRAAVRPREPQHLTDLLIVGALIEARSCERFAALAPRLSPDIGRFYAGLLEAEARHFGQYLDFAHDAAGGDVERRISELREIENQLILSPDDEFRFHSGVPANTPAS